MGTELLGIVITGMFTIVVAVIHRGNKRQQKDHGLIGTSLDRIERKLDRHLEDHD
jgi:hypothetical protein